MTVWWFNVIEAPCLDGKVRWDGMACRSRAEAQVSTDYMRKCLGWRTLYRIRVIPKARSK